MLATALFAIALAVGGLAVGVWHVWRGLELGSFAFAVAAALAAAWRALGGLLWASGDAKLWWSGSWESHGGKAARWTMGLLTAALLAATLVAVVRSGSTAAPVPPPAHAGTVVVLGGGSGGLAPGVVGAGILLAVAAAAVAAILTGRRRAAAAAGVGALGLAGALAFGLSHIEPRIDFAPTLKIEQPTLFAFQRGSGSTARPPPVIVQSHMTVRLHVAVGLHVAVHPPVAVHASTNPRPFTLLSLGGLRISIRLRRGAHCGCGGTLPITP